MATWTPPVIIPAGNPLPTAAWNGLANDVTFLYQRPYAMLYDSGGTTVPNGAPTQINLGGITAMNYGFSVTSNNAIVPLAGIYSVQFAVQMGAGEGGLDSDFLQAQAFHNGAEFLSGSLVGSYTVEPASTGSGLMSCSAGDEIALIALQTSAFTLSTAPNANATFIHIMFMGSQ